MKMKDKYKEKVSDLVLGNEFFLAGSRLVPSSVKETSDWDYMVYSPEGGERHIAGRLFEEGYTCSSQDSRDYPSTVLVFRKQDINIMLIRSRAQFILNKAASELTELLQIKSREHRVAVYKLLRSLEDQISQVEEILF